MPNYRLTTDAKADVIGIRRYTLQQWGEAQSKKYLAELRQTLRLLSETPTLGKICPDVGPNVRRFPYISHLVYYVIHDQKLVVFAVLHTRMAPVDHLEKREFI